MIKGKYKAQEFEINEGTLTRGSQQIRRAFSILLEDFPGPSEGDPDYVLFQRLKQRFPDIILVKYIPMELDPDVVY